MGKWVLVTERLPKEHEEVLGVNKNGTYRVCYWYKILDWDDKEIEKWVISGEECWQFEPIYWKKVPRCLLVELADG